MNLKVKIVSSFSVLVALSLIVLSLVLGHYSSNKASQTLTDQISERLIGLRDAKKEQLNDYFQLIDDQIITLASSETLIEASADFIKEFHLFDNSKPDPTMLSKYYHDEFIDKYQQQNNKSIEVSPLFSLLDQPAIHFQNLYIAQNQYPLGSKNKLINATDDSGYTKLHQRYHEFLNQYLERFGYYDIFVADVNTGHVVYSVYKEIDFATSLLNGPFKDTGLAQAFNHAKTLKAGEIAFSDFQEYLPSYDAAAAFIATPIVKENNTIAVLIFQMPIDKINAITTYNQQWSSRGLGQSGETYLVGQNHKMRSLSRSLIEDKSNYLAAIKQSGESAQTIVNIDRKNTSVGFQTINNESIKKALAGESGIMTVNDYRGIAVISAYTQLNFHGQTWALVNEIDESEAFTDIKTLVSNITFITLGTTSLMLFLSFLAALYLSNYIVTPIRKLSNFISSTADTMDLSQRVDESLISKDEIGIVMNSFNQMLDTFDNTLLSVNKASEHLSNELQQLQLHFNDVISKTRTQTDLTIQISAAMEQMATTSEDVAFNAQQTSDASHGAVEEAEKGNQDVSRNLDASKRLSDAMESTSKQMEQLEEKTKSISTVLDVIRSIADQTNLLALNAAIEAARAGDQGRGFSVVADEVRTLAQRTQESTTEINQIIQTLQQGSESSMQAMKISHDLAAHTLTSAEDTGTSLQSINEQIHKIEAFNEQMATAATEQSAVARDVTKQVSDITNLANENDASIQAASESANLALNESNEVKQQIAKFKLSE